MEDKVTGKRLNIYVTGRGEWNNETGEYETLPEGVLRGKKELNQYQLPGDYELIRVQIRDRANNEQWYVKNADEWELEEGYKELTLNKKITVINVGEEFDFTTNTNNPNLAEDIKNIPAPSDTEPPVKIGINYQTGAKLTEDVFKAIAGENKELVLEGGDIQWVFNGKDIENENIKDIDLSVSISNLDNFNGGNTSNIEEIVKDKPTYVLSFPSNGQLPGKATIRLKVDYAFIQHLGREDLCVYYFDATKGELVSIKNNVNVSYDGYVEFEIDHNSDFLITKGEVQEQIKSSNANLVRLSISNGRLSPAFNKDTLNYTVEVGNSVKTITVEGVAEDDKATIVGTGEKALQVGKNTINIRVTAEDGKTTRMYTIVVNRKSSASSGGSSSGGSSSSESTSSTSKPVTTEQVIEKLSKKDREAIIDNFKEEMPYTSLHAVLTLEQLKKLTNNKFTDKQLQEILDKPELLEKLGIDQSMLSSHIVVKPVDDVKFIDVSETHWASDSIRVAAELGLVTGMPDGTFAPSISLQVADTFTFLDRVLLLNDITEMKLSRSTVEKHITNKEHWAFANMASIGSKLSEDTLKVVSQLGEQPITRGLLAQVLYDITDGKLKETRESIVFTDTEVSPYQEGINYCVKTGLLIGTSQTTISPEKVLTRAELMTVLIRLDNLLDIRDEK